MSWNVSAWNVVDYLKNTFDPEARDSLILWSKHVQGLLKASK